MLISADSRFNGGFSEKDLIELAAALGLSYKIEYIARAAYIGNKSFAVMAWVKLKGLKSKRYAVFITDRNSHTKRFSCEVALGYRKPDSDGLSPKDIKRIRDEAAAYTLENILRGCVVKVSETRHIIVPSSSSVEELKLRMAVTGGKA